MSTACYRPTPLERAYATHLLVTYFNTPVDLHNDDAEMRVSGRDAVPFLTSSGVDRSLLRLIWSVADPEGVGTLLVRSQFHTILRLIAMSQAHFLPPQTPGMETQHAALLKESLMNNSHLVMALPTFSQDANPPTVAHLLGMYPTAAASHGVLMGTVSAVENSNVDVSNMLVNHDFQYQMWQKQQQQQMGLGIGGELAPPIQMSVDDAFGDMPEVEDLPLPSLQYSVPEDQVDDHIVVDDLVSNHEDFGEFDAVQNENLPENANPEFPDDEFGNFEGQTDSSLSYNADIGYKTAETQNNGGTTVVKIGETVSEDHFNDFDNAHENVDDKHSATYAEDDHDDFGGFEGGINELNFPNKGDEFNGLGNAIDQSEYTTNNTMSDFELNNNHVPTLPITDAFDSLVAEHEGTTSEIGVTVFAEDNADKNTKVVYTEDESDDFGGFESTTNQTRSEVDDFNESNGFRSTNIQSESKISNHGPTLSISEAFEGLVAEQDEFGSFDSTNDQAFEANEHELNQKHTPDEDDDFNGFQSPDYTEAYNSKRDNAPDIHPQFTNESSSSMMIRQSNHNHELSLSDGFGSMAADQEMSSVPYANSGADGVSVNALQCDTNELIPADDDNDDDFGEFETNDKQMLAAEQQILSSQTSMNAQTLSISDAFNSMVSDDDSFKPETTDAVECMPTSEENQSCEGTFEPNDYVGSDEKKISDDGDPGTENSNNDMPANVTIGHYGFNTNTTGEQLGPVDLSLLDDVFGDIQDAPLPPLESFSPMVYQAEVVKLSEPAGESEFNESFGDFEGNAVIEEHCVEATEPENDTEDDFGDFGGTQDAPLPPLESFSSTVNQGIESERAGEPECNESFGGFEGNMVIEEQGVEATAPENDTEDDFGDFGGTQDAPLPPLESFSPMVNQGIESEPAGESKFNEPFGGFEGNMVIEERDAEATAPENDTEDDFGDFGGTQDAPLPPLESFSSTVNQGIESEPAGESEFNEPFGDFEGNVVTEEHDAGETAPRNDTEDDFGDFGGFSEAQEPSQTEATIIRPEATDDFDDLFGDFAGTDIEPISIRSQCIPNESEDDNLQKSESAQQETNDDFTSFEAGFPDFGQSSSGNSNEHVQQLFGSYNQQDLAPSDETAPEANKTDIECSVQVEMETNLPEHAAAISTSNNHVKMDEGAETFEQGDFGDFSAFGSANDTSETTTGNDFTRQSTGCAGKGAPDSEVSPHATAQIENARPTAREDFTLGSSSALPDATGEWQADDDFGDFATFDGAENTASADVFERDVFGDFAEFDSAPPNDEEITSSIHSSNPHQDLRDKISALDYNHMHQNIIPTKDTVIKCFDRCTNRKQLFRCAILCEILADRALLEQWENAIACIKSDVERGQKILDFFDLKLSSDDKSAILLSDKLSNYMLGLAEFVRIARHIEASMCDLLCLEISSGSDGTLSENSKGEYSVASLIAINKAWCNISARALDSGLLDEIPPLVSVNEIRTRYLNSESSEQLELCQLTLQPLDHRNQGTSSTVTWNCKQYMACAANFLANRLSRQGSF